MCPMPRYVIPRQAPKDPVARTKDQPPVGKYRWAPPQRLDDCTDEIDSTAFGAACPQYVPTKGSVYTFNLTGLRVNSYGQNKFAGEMLQTSQEDCLSLGIWTPANATAQSRLPVIIFITGGGDNTGGVDVDAQKPAGWVHRTQKHIVVTMNHRLNIFDKSSPLSQATMC